MNRVNFEGLGLSFNIDRILININGIKIYCYAFIIVISITICLLFCKKDSGKYSIKFDDILSLAVFLFPISIISARIYFILFKLDYYIEHTNELLNIQNGGLAIYGGIIGAIGTIIVFCKLKKIRVLDMLDYLAPYLALGQAIGRWGNFFNVEAYGIETSSILRMGIMENGKYVQVHPTFLYESICTLIIFLFLYSKRNKRNYSGQIAFWYFFLYGIARAIIESLRADSLMFYNIKISMFLSIILSIIFGSTLFYKKIRNNY